MRGITAQQVHGQLRHAYIVVDPELTNYKEYLFERIKHLPHGGILHVLRGGTYEELERMYV